MKIKKGTVAVVTGGASGLGLSVVAFLLKRGCSVAILDFSEERLTNLPQTLPSLDPALSLCIKVDVSKEEEVKGAFETVVEKFKSVHIAVNCAGIPSVLPTLSGGGKNGFDTNTFKMAIEINLMGSIYVAKYAALQMSKQAKEIDGDRGVIINTSSVAAFDGQRGQISYSASKGGIAGMTLPMARDLGRSNIRVVTIAPGLFETPMSDLMAEKARDAILKDIPLSRFGNSKEYASLVRECIENTYLNGVVLRLDGGALLSHL